MLASTDYEANKSTYTFKLNPTSKFSMMKTLKMIV